MHEYQFKVGDRVKIKPGDECYNDYGLWFDKTGTVVFKGPLGRPDLMGKKLYTVQMDDDHRIQLKTVEHDLIRNK